jgi:(E)-4-hydroxy-3-methylbut-2-enyl-diphosphate synthase
MSGFPIQTYHNFRSSVVPAGKVLIGGNNPVVVQSMTTTRTIDTKATVRQIIQLADAGCEMVRMAVQNKKEARNLENIKNELLKKDYGLPLVADVHFNPDVAVIAARFVEKVRINPGNFIKGNPSKKEYNHDEYGEELKKTEEKLIPLIEICRSNNTAVRIGVNHGSLSNRILVRYGNTPEGMVESAMEFIHIFRKYGFELLDLSLKASNVRIMTEANKLMVERMIKEGFYYPMHLGVTEAGAGIDGRIKSAAGIGHLLMLGIGDTIRVSLTEDPVEEIPVAQKLVELYGRKKSPEINTGTIILRKIREYAENEKLKSPYNVSAGLSEVADFSLEKNYVWHRGKKLTGFEKSAFPVKEVSEKDIVITRLDYDDDQESVRLRAAAEFAFLQDIYPTDGICLENRQASTDANAQLSLDILQALGLRFNKAEFIACPSCGRTNFDIQEHLKRVKEKTAQLKGLKIAVMGCIVNGPGEMAGADYGYVGSGRGKINLYKSTSLVRKNIDEASAVEALTDLIRENGDWPE